MNLEIKASTVCIKNAEKRYIQHFWKTLLENYVDSECQLLETLNEESPGLLLQRFYIYRSRDIKVSIIVPTYLASVDEGYLGGSAELPIEIANEDFRSRDKEKQKIYRTNIIEKGEGEKDESIIRESLLKLYAIQGLSSYDAEQLCERGYRDDDAYEIKEGTKLVYAADSKRPFMVFHRTQDQEGNEIPPPLCMYRILMHPLIAECISKINAFGGTLVSDYCSLNKVDYSKRLEGESSMNFFTREYPDKIEDFALYVTTTILPQINSFINDLMKAAEERSILKPFHRLYNEENKENKSEREYICAQVYAKPTIYIYPKTLKARADDIEFNALPEELI